MSDAPCSESDWNYTITLLRLDAGRLIEQAVDGLASCLPGEPVAGEDQLKQDLRDADDIRALLAAAEVLHRRCELRTHRLASD